ncbi:hypothetical protein [Allonocardiopsis opalescens]|uniref:Uncharacterized protein n=1 Tax=Allonocardiopsis opalescens TaxID=1144618 RepID=A0A2T0PU37_9ACTN|nr:hypothetical protein [Allonocardiopsis opalescens]PRX92417.1 hypothetical protein CLV72_110177 [Allonocardiopsis opalescens]
MVSIGGSLLVLAALAVGAVAVVGAVVLAVFLATRSRRPPDRN